MTDKTVTRADLADAIRHEVGLSHYDCRKLIEDVLNEITYALVEGESVGVSSFGSFTIRHKEERMGRNPRTGDQAVIPARRIIRFKASNKLKSLVAVREQ